MLGYLSDIEELEIHVDESLKACKDSELDLNIVQNQPCNSKSINKFSRWKICVEKQRGKSRSGATQLFTKNENNELAESYASTKVNEYEKFKQKIHNHKRYTIIKRQFNDVFTPPNLPISLLTIYNNEAIE